MKKTMLLILCLFVMGCSVDNRNRMDITPKNPELQPFLDDFIAMAKINGYDTSVFNYIELGMTFGELEGSTIGLCRTNYSQSQITIDASFWKYAYDVDKRALMFHELGHCLLFKGHEKTTTTLTMTDNLNNTFNRVMPKSLMYPTLVSLYFPAGTISYLANTLMPNHYFPDLFKSPGVPIGSDNGATQTDNKDGYHEIVEFRDDIEEFSGQ